MANTYIKHSPVGDVRVSTRYHYGENIEDVSFSYKYPKIPPHVIGAVSFIMQDSEDRFVLELFYDEKTHVYHYCVGEQTGPDSFERKPFSEYFPHWKHILYVSGPTFHCKEDGLYLIYHEGRLSTKLVFEGKEEWLSNDTIM